MYIPTDTKQINILISGGMDSTLLLFLLLKENVNSIPINTFTFYAANTAINNSNLKVLQTSILPWMENHFDVKINHQLMNKSPWIRSAVEHIWLAYGGYVYTGCNKVIYDKFIPTVYIPNDTPPVRGEPFSDIHLRPFIDLDKIQIVEMYKSYNIIELMNLTKSCGISDPPCNGCYFCMERQWACKKLGLLF